jgi:hypothetical protein
VKDDLSLAIDSILFILVILFVVIIVPLAYGGSPQP